MRRLILVLLLAAAVAFAAACEETTPEQQKGLAKVQIGDSMAQVRAKVGKPTDKQAFNQKDPVSGRTLHTECWYYGVGEQVCFDFDGKVDSKNSY